MSLYSDYVELLRSSGDFLCSGLLKKEFLGIFLDRNMLVVN